MNDKQSADYDAAYERYTQHGGMILTPIQPVDCFDSNHLEIIDNEIEYKLTPDQVDEYLEIALMVKLYANDCLNIRMSKFPRQ